VTPEQWERAKELFYQALEHQPAERPAFFDAACAGDETIRAELESLVAEEQRIGDFMNVPAVGCHDWSPGKVILQYEVIEKVGEGGMGVVYRARDTRLDRFVALKRLPVEMMADTGRRRRFVREAKAASILNHPNIITIHDIGREGDNDFIVMEYIEGDNLREILRSGQKLSLIQIMKIMSQVADGLHYAHQRGIIHRDVKPANIMLLTDSTVKVLDFGIARVLNADSTSLTVAGSLVGTLQWMSPEQLRGGAVDALCDIWACGATFYEMLAGRHPFDAPDNVSLMYKITHTEPDPLRSLAPECPDALEEIVMRALAKERDLRYQSLEDLRLDIEPILMDLQRKQGSFMVTAAQEALQRGDTNSAQAMVRQILDLDPTNQKARAMRDGISLEARRRSAQPQVEGILRSAEDNLARHRLPEAVQSLSVLNQAQPGNLVSASGQDQFRGIRRGRAVSWAGVGLLALALTVGGTWIYRSRHVRTSPELPTLNGSAPKSNAASMPVATSRVGASTTQRQQPPAPSEVSPLAAQMRKRPLPTPRPALQPDEYSGPLQGELKWSGSLEPGEALRIQGGKCEFGVVSGDLPRVPNRVEVVTSGITVADQPSAANQWDRLVLLNRSSMPLRTVQIRWRSE
jgi:serine/threonine protein kinase